MQNWNARVCCIDDTVVCWGTSGGHVARLNTSAGYYPHLKIIHWRLQVESGTRFLNSLYRATNATLKNRVRIVLMPLSCNGTIIQCTISRAEKENSEAIFLVLVLIAQKKVWYGHKSARPLWNSDFLTVDSHYDGEDIVEVNVNYCRIAVYCNVVSFAEGRQMTTFTTMKDLSNV